MSEPLPRSFNQEASILLTLLWVFVAELGAAVLYGMALAGRRRGKVDRTTAAP